MATPRKHTFPCNQQDNIEHLKESYADIKTDIKGINKTINGNGDGIGMKTDLALVVQRTEGLKDFLERKEKEKDNNKKILISKISLWVAIAAFIVLLTTNIVTWVKDAKFKREWSQEVKNMVPSSTTRGIHEYPVLDTLLSDTIKNDSIK